MEAGMRWDDTYDDRHGFYKWHDLLAGDGTDKDALLGYIREDLTKCDFMAVINEGLSTQAKFDNLEDAKAHIVTYYVTQKLEGT
jgi:hypothetical protein